MKKKIIAIVLAVVILATAIVAGTLAWLSSKTDSITNTFVIGNVSITLTESDSELDDDGDSKTNSYKIIPGGSVKKDPKVTVLEDSEDCYVFIKVEETNGTVSTIDIDGDDTPDEVNVLSYSLTSNWKSVNGAPGVYYYEVSAQDGETPAVNIVKSSGSNTPLQILADDKVSFSSDINQAVMEVVAENAPTLTFTAYAIQSANLKTAGGDDVTTAAGAWALLEAALTPAPQD